MKLVTITDLISAGSFPGSPTHGRVMGDLREAIAAVHWPPGSAHFTIYPESGKKRGAGNGVGPIKQGFVEKLKTLGWRLEERYPQRTTGQRQVHRPGAFDAWLDLSSDGWSPFVTEWETGNISSSHRAINKMAMGLLGGHISAGVLVLPTRALYRYLTDRVGNYQELEPYFPLWSALSIKDGYLGVVAVEHDATSTEVPRITKGTDGRALI
ncbi:MAG: hypothetical protein HY332_01085 [Chloroflexi bacterium]|nr:hypothetical protein [Chloroflexota bacterium]